MRRGAGGLQLNLLLAALYQIRLRCQEGEHVSLILRSREHVEEMITITKPRLIVVLPHPVSLQNLLSQIRDPGIQPGHCPVVLPFECSFNPAGWHCSEALYLTDHPVVS